MDASPHVCIPSFRYADSGRASSLSLTLGFSLNSLFSFECTAIWNAGGGRELGRSECLGV